MNNDIAIGRAADGTEGRSTADLIDCLRGQLSTAGKKLPVSAASEIAPLVNLLAVAFTKEESDETALASLAVITLAGKKGSKDAKKRIPKIVRWTNRPPPSLQILLSDDERRGAIELFAASRPAWLPEYTFREAFTDGCGKQLIADLVKCAYRAVETSARLLDGLTALPVAHVAEDADRFRAVCNHLTKVLTTARVVAGSTFPESYHRLSEWLAELAAFSAKKGAATDYQAFGVAVGDIVSATEPGLLFDVNVHSALRSLRQLNGDWGTAAQKRLPALSIRMLSIALLNAKIHGLAASADFTILLRAAEAVVPILKAVKKFKNEPLLNRMVSTSAGDLEDVEKTSGPRVHEHLASVIVAWDAVKSTIRHEINIDEIDVALETLAQSMSMVRFGQPGDVTAYDPVQQQLLGPAGPAVDRITITTAGVHYIRADGTRRVLVKALVTPM